MLLIAPRRHPLTVLFLKQRNQVLYRGILFYNNYLVKILSYEIADMMAYSRA